MKNISAHTPDWLAKSAIYQINPRTFCEEGTIKAIIKELPFIASMGFGIVYICPIFEADDSEDRSFWSIRQKASETNNPKNPYRMNSYFEIDSEYGTNADLRELVEECHKLGMRILLDLVYLHMGPNARIFKRHPEFAKQDADGNVIKNYWNFPELDYDHEGVREYMWSNMVYFIGEFGVDGYRCDVGDSVPLDFWREGLRRIRTINSDAVLIDEGWNHLSLKVFHSMYSFYWHDCMHEVVVGNATVKDLREKWQEFHDKQLKGSKLLRDTDTHDTVTDWPERTEITVGHNGMEQILAINYLIDGIPMVYAGNELGDTSYHSMFANRFHRGKFEATDRAIAKEDYSIRRQQIVKTLNTMKKEWEILDKGDIVWLNNNNDEKIISFERSFEGKRIVFIGNLSKEDNSVVVEKVIPANMKVVLQSEVNPVIEGEKVSLEAFDYVVLED